MSNEKEAPPALASEENDPRNATNVSDNQSKEDPRSYYNGQSIETTMNRGPGTSMAEGEMRSSSDGPPNPRPPENTDQSEIAPPPYSETYGKINLSQGGLKTQAQIENDGRVGISIGEDSSVVSKFLMPTLKRHLSTTEAAPTADVPPGYIPPSLGGVAGDGTPPPPMNIVIHVVGSRGDVQPFVALGKVLKGTYGHRVRLATHKAFKDFVTDNGLEFFSIGGDPAELMAFMVKNPSLMPGTEALLNGDIRKRRKGMYEIVHGCWRSCFEAGDGTQVPALAGDPTDSFDDSERPFVADAIIANPPSFAHVHCAEKLGIPLHLMFTMPWSPTQAFPHPLANIHKSGADVSVTNFVSYVMVELMTWQGLGDIINRFREKHLHLEPLSMMWGPGIASRLRIPYTYCWSPSLIPKPKDWNQHISISGFYFLSSGSDYQPASDLAAFLDAGPPPVYIGFGSIVVEDPNVMTDLIFEAVKLSGQRALVSKGWGGFGGDEIQVPEGVFMLGNVPHDWLFKCVSCVVHHGGAGTTSAGIALGRPTIIVPFFGDQPFWGAMVAKAGAGPEPIPSKQLTAENLAAAIQVALQDSTKQRAQELADSIAHEKGTDVGAKSFHDQLDVDSMRCSLAPSRVAVWELKRSKVKLSAVSVAVLMREGKLDVKDLRIHRSKECDTESTPLEPIGGATAALIGTASSMMMGITDIPVDIFRGLVGKSSTEGSQDNHEPSAPKQSEDANSSSSYSLDRVVSPENSSTRSIDTSSTEATNRSANTSTSRSISSNAMKGKTPVRPPFTIDDAEDVTRGIGRVFDAGMKSPMDFTMALATGFRNAPKLYGDKTIRPVDRVTGLQSGLKVAGKEFSYGLYDGISGLVTQPMAGAKKGGFSGFLKGFGKGIGGVVMKPSAAAFALPGYTFKGIYKELQKQSGAGLQNYIIAARTAQGIEEADNANEAERRDIVSRWDALQPELSRQRRYWYLDTFKPSSAAQAPLTKPVPAAMSPSPVGPASTDAQPQPPDPPQSGFNKEYEEAVRQSVIATSKGDPDEDAAVENAIRASLAEFARRGNPDENEEDLTEAIRANIPATNASRSPGPVHSGFDTSHQAIPSGDDPTVESDDDENIKRAIEESKGPQYQGSNSEEEQLSRAIGESRRAHEGTERQAQAEEEAVIAYMKKQSLADSQHGR